jgi:hypothetical protein
MVNVDVFRGGREFCIWGKDSLICFKCQDQKEMEGELAQLGNIEAMDALFEEIDKNMEKVFAFN